jgi:L-galactose dehydrogenase/L-glyceraldehyde 3-phosphate reductase
VRAPDTRQDGSSARIALTPAQVLGRGGVADTFDRLRQQGLVRAVGLTVAGDSNACRKVIESGRFDTAQVYYNAINPSAAWQRLPAGCEPPRVCRRPFGLSHAAMAGFSSMAK